MNTEQPQAIGPWDVRLDYFKGSGKWYSEGSYKSHKEHLFQIWEEVAELMTSKPPGLVAGPYSFDVLVTVEAHPHSHPHIVRRRKK